MPAFAFLLGKKIKRRKNMKKRILQLLIGLVLIYISSVYLNAFWVANDPWDGHGRGKSSAQIGDSIVNKASNSQIGDLIVNSASNLLQSASEAFLFMNEVEIADQSGANINAALQRVDLAAAKAAQALSDVMNIIAFDRELGYDAQRTASLKAFDYKGFASANGLNQEIMAQVAVYLAKGNMLGFHQQHGRNLVALLNILNRIKDDLNAGKLSENKVLWSLLHQYNATMMFANYASLVFYTI
jgi:hypothetical protein